MEKVYEQKYHELEREQWWFRSRRDMVLRYVRQFPAEKILDIGCSSGLLLENLQEEGFLNEQLYGIDISPEGIEKCREKGFDNCHVMDGAAIDLPKDSFDLLVASDCLEHIENDKKALANWYGLLRPGGVLICFVPAFMSLWSAHDVVNHHFRRYTKKELVEKMQAAEFKVMRSGYWNALLFPPVFAFRKVKNMLGTLKKEHEPQEDLQPTASVVNAALTNLLRLENALLENGTISFPFGVSTFCIAKK